MNGFTKERNDYREKCKILLHNSRMYEMYKWLYKAGVHTDTVCYKLDYYFFKTIKAYEKIGFKCIGIKNKNDRLNRIAEFR